MGFTAWNPQFSVHDPEMDEQHRTIFRLANQLQEGISQRRNGTALGRIIEDLLGYTERHFAEEERLMRRHNYPGYTRHKLAHEQLTGQVLEFERKFRAGDGSFSAEMFQFLVSDWLVKHILGMDKLYAPYLKS